MRRGPKDLHKVRGAVSDVEMYRDGLAGDEARTRVLSAYASEPRRGNGRCCRCTASRRRRMAFQ